MFMVVKISIQVVFLIYIDRKVSLTVVLELKLQ